MVGIYVNGDGVRSRTQELIWHSNPSQIGNLIILIHLPVLLLLLLLLIILYIIIIPHSISGSIFIGVY